MPQDSTTAAAQGNANAQVNVTTTPLPAELEFREYLTAEELGRHFETNEEVLEIAEEIDRLEAEIAAVYSNDYYRVSGSAVDDRDGLLVPLAQSHIDRYQRQIAQKEQEILDEITEVEGEFRMLARNLTDNRRRTIQMTSQQQRILDGTEAGYSDYRVGIGMVGVQQGLDALEASFERYSTSYEAIKQGFAFQSSSEMWRNFAIGFAQMVAIEVATLGAAKFFRVAQAANRIRTAVVGSSYYAAMAARFAALSAATKTRLSRLRRTRQPERPPNRSETGPTSERRNPSAAGRTCASGACR